MTVNAFIGSWALVSSVFKNQNGELNYPLGEQVLGRIHSEANGTMAAQLYSAVRPRFAADDYLKKLEFLKSDPVTKHMDAVKNDRIVIVDADSTQGSIRMADGLEQMAEGALKIIKGAKK